MQQNNPNQPSQWLAQPSRSTQQPKPRLLLSPWFIILCIAMCLCVMPSCGTDNALPDQAAKPQPSPLLSASTATPTTAPAATKAALSQPAKTTMPPAAPGPTVLGQPLSHFLYRYGTPMDQQTAKDGLFSWNGGNVSVFAYSFDHQLVSSVLFAGTDGNGWGSQEAATTSCRSFLPGDATFKRDVTISTGMERVYLSPSVAPLLQASEFTNENGNVTTPGTIAIVYHTDIADASHITDCVVQAGLEGK